MRSWTQTRCGLAVLVLVMATGMLASGGPMPGAETESEAKKKHQLSWWESARSSKTTPAAQLAYADQVRDEGRLIFASKQYRALTFAWPQSPEASKAQYRYAQLLEKRGKDMDAFEEYQYLLETYAGFVPYEEVLERQYGIADRVATEPHYFLFFPYMAPEDAIPLFETLIQNGPQWKRSAELQFRIARIYEIREEYDLALDAYALFQQKYPFSSLAEQAAFGHGKCAYKYSLENPNAIDLRQNAEAVLLSFLERYPRGDMSAKARSYLKELQQAQALGLYRQAEIYGRDARGDPRNKEVRTAMTAARVCYQRVIDEYPLSRWAENARAEIARIDKKMETSHERN